MPEITRIGVLTGGGDAPGLNAVIRAVVKAASNCGIECVGLEDSFDGLIEPGRSAVLTPRDVTGILRFGGTILGTTNRGNPFAYPVATSEGVRDYSDRCVEMFHQLGLGALIVIGGDGTLAIAHQFCERGIPVVGVPKTIDNDIVGTTNCFGFDTAVAFATDAIDRLHTTAEAHHRIMIAEVMGRYAGWIALYAGVARGAAPTSSDRVLATRFGGKAVELVQRGDFGTMVAFDPPDIVARRLEDVVGKTKTVPLDHDLLLTAKALGVTFGD